MENSLKCRKCGGKHLTIKCGNKDNVIEAKQNTVIEFKQNDNKFKQNDNKFRQNDNKFRQNYDDREKRTYNKVKISNLPFNITTDELTCLLEQWGHINRVYVKNFKENSFAIIEFKFKDELDYFIKAIDSTPFENQMIGVTELDNF
tara:strand:- start:457 stop:894 length:438 start_codon:yes stop_codon:yes gene_type:complete